MCAQWKYRLFVHDSRYSLACTTYTLCPGVVYSCIIFFLQWYSKSLPLFHLTALYCAAIRTKGLFYVWYVNRFRVYKVLWNVLRTSECVLSYFCAPLLRVPFSHGILRKIDGRVGDKENSLMRHNASDHRWNVFVRRRPDDELDGKRWTVAVWSKVIWWFTPCIFSPGWGLVVFRRDSL